MSDQVHDEVLQAVRLAAKGAFGAGRGDLYATAPADVWRNLAHADLLSLVIPEARGGAGQGSSLAVLGALFEEAGSALGHRPLWSALALGTMPLVDHFPWEAVDADLADRSAGRAMTVGAFTEGPAADWEVIDTRLIGSDRLTLRGSKTFVWDMDSADKVLVPAVDDRGSIVLVHLPTSRTGISVTNRPSTDHRWISELALDKVSVGKDEVAELPAGLDDLRLIRRRAEHLMACTLVGAASTALDLTVAHIRERRQFGRPLASFQSVALRAADCWILLQVARSTIAHAAKRGTSDSIAHEAAVVWALRAGSFVVDTAHHLHGGVGVGLDYPLWKYTRTCRHLELKLGSEAAHLDEIQTALDGDVTRLR